MLSFVTKWRVVIDLSRFRIEKYSLFKNFQGTLELKGFVVFEIVMLLFTLNKSWKQLNSSAKFLHFNMTPKLYVSTFPMCVLVIQE